MPKKVTLAVILIYAIRTFQEVRSQVPLDVTVDQVPYRREWSHISVPSQDTPIEFTISVKQQNSDELVEIASAVSDPQSSQYGKFLTQAQLDLLTGPTSEDFASVTSWLDAHGVQYSVSRHSVEVNTTVATAERLLQTSFHTVTDGNQTVVRAGNYRVPLDVWSAVGAIFHLHGLPLPPKTLSAPSAEARRPAAPVTPSVLATTYMVGGVSANRSAPNVQAVAEFQGQYMSKADLVQFFKTEVPRALPGDDQVSAFKGSPYKAGNGLEAALDIQYLMGMAPGVKTQFWEFASSDFCKDLHDWTNALLTADPAPLVNSVSYGWQGALSDIQCSEASAAVVDLNFVKLAARGITILFASGDSGSGQPPACTEVGGVPPGVEGVEIVSGTLLHSTTEPHSVPSDCCIGAYAPVNNASGWTWTADGTCKMYSHVTATRSVSVSTTRSGGPAIPVRQPQLFPSWPASSPWVTAVGATRFVGSEAYGEEMATMAFGSGGGFSDMWNRTHAKWQEGAVAAYLKKLPSLPKAPPLHGIPSVGRATPDVSALGQGFQIVMGNAVVSIGGTSASTPLFAALVSLINDQRLSHRRPPMGFLNPFLYQNADAFTDITKGTNAISRYSDPLQYGYAATEGWDAATGLGTPRFDLLLIKAMSICNGRPLQPHSSNVLTLHKDPRKGIAIQ